MLQQYFGFKEEPFGATPDPRCLYPSHTHREALASLAYGFHSNRGFTAMIAPPGMGKTTLLFRFLEDIRESARTIFLFDIDASCEPREFVGHILRDVGVVPGSSSSEMHEQLSSALAKETRTGRKFVIVIDEAQNLSDAVLERVRLLSNFETSRGKLMQIVLSGQPQLAEKLMLPSLVQLRQRVSTICRIDPLSEAETVAYIEYRLNQAGYAGKPLFTKEALKLIAEVSRGTPRIINNLCFNGLSLCCAMKGKEVDGSIMSEVIADLQLIQDSVEPTKAPRKVESARSRGTKQRVQVIVPLNRWVFATAALVLASVLGLLGLTVLWFPRGQSVVENRPMNLPGRPGTATAASSVNADETVVPESAERTKPLVITVEPHQQLQRISMQYLGGYDLKRLHQIQALNPGLTDPDHIETGEKLWLPGSNRAQASGDAITSASERKHP